MSVRAPNWIWPKELRPETTVIVRLGRVLHWITVSVAALCAAIGLTLRHMH